MALYVRVDEDDFFALNEKAARRSAEEVARLHAGVRTDRRPSA